VNGETGVPSPAPAHPEPHAQAPAFGGNENVFYPSLVRNGHKPHPSLDNITFGGAQESPAPSSPHELAPENGGEVARFLSLSLRTQPYLLLRSLRHLSILAIRIIRQITSCLGQILHLPLDPPMAVMPRLSTCTASNLVDSQPTKALITADITLAIPSPPTTPPMVLPDHNLNHPLSHSLAQRVVRNMMERLTACNIPMALSYKVGTRVLYPSNPLNTGSHWS
jgi:hypothetical protein